MKKKWFILHIALILSAVFSFSCTTTYVPNIDDDTLAMGKFIDNDTFVIRTYGAYKVDEDGNMVKDVRDAVEAAKIFAMQEVIRKVKGAEIKGSSDVSNSRLQRITVSKKIQGQLKDGEKIGNEKCNDKGCFIIYKFQAEGLKKFVESGKGVSGR